MFIVFNQEKQCNIFFSTIYQSLKSSIYLSGHDSNLIVIRNLHYSIIQVSICISLMYVFCNTHKHLVVIFGMINSLEIHVYTTCAKKKKRNSGSCLIKFQTVSKITSVSLERLAKLVPPSSFSMPSSFCFLMKPETLTHLPTHRHTHNFTFVFSMKDKRYNKVNICLLIFELFSL